MVMTRNGSICLGILGLLLTTGARPAHAQVTDARLHELLRQAADRVASGQTGGQAPAPGATTLAQRPTVRMTLDDAVKAALDHNLNITVQRLNPEVSDISISSLQATYRPVLTSQLATQSQTNASNTTIAGGSSAGAPIVTGLSTWNAGFTQNVPKFGSSFLLNLNNNKSTTSSLNSLYNPTYNTNWNFQMTQPLLRNLRTDTSRQGIAVAKINRDITDVQLRATITNTLSNVRTAYWNYVFSVQSVEVTRQSLALAEQLVQNNQIKVQVGTMAPLDVVQAQSQAATARQALAAAVGTMRTSELALKALVVSGTEDPVWASTIDPIDRPEFRPEAVDVEGAVRRALSERTDLQIAKKNLESNGVTVRYLKDQLMPQADLVANYGLIGIGGNLLAKSGSGVNQVATGVLAPGGYTDALSTLFRTNYPRWTVTLNFSYPLGLSSAQAVVARANVQQSQIAAQLKQIELQVATDVTNAATTVQSNVERVQAAQSARELAQRRYGVGEATRIGLGEFHRPLPNQIQIVGR